MISCPALEAVWCPSTKDLEKSYGQEALFSCLNTFQTSLTTEYIIIELASEQTWGSATLGVEGRRENQHMRPGKGIYFVEKKVEMEFFF